MKQQRKLHSKVPSGFLDGETSLIGELEVSGAFCVDCYVHGSIKTFDTLIVGKKGTVQGDIDAGEVQILGTVLGNINCRGPVEISDGGRLKGEVRTPQLIIAKGGVFEGLSSVTADSAHVVLPLG